MKDIIKTEIIENFIQENNISKTQFCKLCKINLKTLNKILSNNTDFGVIALFKIAKVMKIQVYQIFN